MIYVYIYVHIRSMYISIEAHQIAVFSQRLKRQEQLQSEIDRTNNIQQLETTQTSLVKHWEPPEKSHQQQPKAKTHQHIPSQQTSKLISLLTRLSPTTIPRTSKGPLCFSKANKDLCLSKEKEQKQHPNVFSFSRKSDTSVIPRPILCSLEECARKLEDLHSRFAREERQAEAQLSELSRELQLLGFPSARGGVVFFFFVVLAFSFHFQDFQKHWRSLVSSVQLNFHDF